MELKLPKLEWSHVISIAVSIIPVILPHILPQHKDTSKNIIINNYYYIEPKYHNYFQLLSENRINRVSYF
jgi:hypothetical protein